MNNKTEALALLVVIAFSLSLTYFGLFEKAGFLLPTYDNSMLHTGRVRYVVETGHWSDNELVFGGKTLSYHVPAYASLVASLSVLTGLNWLWAVRLFALLQAVLLPLGAYLLARKLAGNGYAGVAAAFFILLSPSLMSWGTRTSAISLGVILLLFVLYAILERRTLPALAGAVVLALTHQPSLLVLCFTLALFVAFVFVEKILAGKKFGLRAIIGAVDLPPFFAGLIAFMVYMGWHVKVTGLNCLDFKCLPQLAAHEFGKSIDLVQYFSAVPAAFGVLGLLWFPFDKRIPPRCKLLLAAWFLATLLLIKNDAFGVNVFTERFLTFFDMAIAVLGGVFVGGILTFLEETK